MSRRTIALVIAVVLAAVATIALVSYIKGVENDALGEGLAVEVFVAKETIPAGTSFESAQSRALIDKTTVPQKVVTLGAVGSLDEIKGKVAAITILPGDQIVAARWVAPGQARTGGLLNIPRTRQAISVEVGIVRGVSGNVQVGDRVSVMAQLTVPRGNATETRVQFILQNLEVLQLGRRVVQTQAEGGGTTQQQPQDKLIFTLAVTPRQAERLVFAVLQGQLYFTLLPPGQKSVTTPGRTTRNAFP